MVRSQALTIGQLAKAGSVGVETVRYYQRRGLLDTPTPTRDGAIRRYGPEDVRRLLFIRQAQTAGFTLEEIRELLHLDSSADRPRARDIAAHRIDALNSKIAELERARDALLRLTTECDREDHGPCPILRSFGL